MPLKIEYNKTFMQHLGRALRVREMALPTLQAKESALRLEVKRARQELAELQRRLAERQRELEPMARLWCEFPEALLSVERVRVGERKVAGVKVPWLEGIDFAVKPFGRHCDPAWYTAGVGYLQELAALRLRCELSARRAALLELARRKTTQKVNLYEKVQIPEYRDAMRRIKRFLEDEENLSKSAQKMLKDRMAAMEMAA